MDRRYIPCKCLQSGNEFIPFWLLNYIKHEDYGKGYYTDSIYEASYHDLVDCLWDIKHKKVIVGIIKNIYIKDEDLEYKKGETVLLESDGSSYKIDKILDVTFEEYDTTVVKAKNMEDYYSKYFTDEEKKNLKDEVYELRIWKPFYILESGKKTKWSYQIRRLVNG